LPVVARVVFTPNLQRHVACGPAEAEGATVREVLDKVFHENDQVRSYVLDDQQALRKHMVIFINGAQMKDRIKLSDPVSADSEIYIMQALSGG
jgi:molybdopterin synthase sulfur carrier subunit